MADDEDWMKPMDKRILTLLAETRRVKLAGLWVKPNALALNMDASRSYVNLRLVALAEHGLVDRDEGGFYRINDQGYHYIQSGRP